MESYAAAPGAATYNTDLAAARSAEQPTPWRDLPAQVIHLMGERYADFGPTLAAEKPAETYSLRVGVETLRQ
jgi:hypothetical protein